MNMTKTHLAAMVGSYLSIRKKPQNVFLHSEIPEENLLMSNLARWNGEGSDTDAEWILNKGWDYLTGAINYYRYGFPLSPGEMFKAAKVYEEEVRNNCESQENFLKHYQPSGAATVIRLMRDAARSKARELYPFPCKPEALPGYNATPWVIKELPDDLAITSPVGLFSTTADRPVNQ
tara:strand:+ start:320 stop:850 length:531 start_codon:yes stop_codon:yes gene_type:complete